MGSLDISDNIGVSRGFDLIPEAASKSRILGKKTLTNMQFKFHRSMHASMVNMVGVNKSRQISLGNTLSVNIHRCGLWTHHSLWRDVGMCETLWGDNVRWWILKSMLNTRKDSRAVRQMASELESQIYMYIGFRVKTVGKI